MLYEFSCSIASISLLGTSTPVHVWRDPYVEKSVASRKDTERDSSGLRFAWGDIFATGLELTYSRREIDIVMAWSVDRLGRSLQHLVHFLGDLQGCGADLYLHKQGVDTTTPGGKALFQMMGVFAEFEREMIRERVNAGLARAKAQGKRLGRPPVSSDVERAIREARAQGKGMLRIARDVGVGRV